MSVATGPAALQLEYNPDAVMDVSFRVLMHYDPGYDTHEVRLDWLKSGMQVNGRFHVRRTKNEGKIGDGRDELIMPPKYEGFAVQTNSHDLIGVLREMANRLEQQVAADVEAMKP